MLASMTLNSMVSSWNFEGLIVSFEGSGGGGVAGLEALGVVDGDGDEATNERNIFAASDVVADAVERPLELDENPPGINAPHEDGFSFQRSRRRSTMDALIVTGVESTDVIEVILEGVEVLVFLGRASFCEGERVFWIVARRCPSQCRERFRILPVKPSDETRNLMNWGTSIIGSGSRRSM
jgi:hypothetical protein